MKAVKVSFEIFKGVLHSIIIPLLIIYKGGEYLGWWSFYFAALYIITAFLIYEYIELHGIRKLSKTVFITIIEIETFTAIFMALIILSA